MQKKTKQNQFSILHKRHYEQFADGTVKDIEDEIPFDLPKNWAWTKAKCIYNIRSAIRIHQTDWRTSGIPFFRGRELVELCKTGNVNPEIFISEELYEQNKEKGGVPQKNDLLVSAVGTLGYVHIVEGTRKFYYKDAYILCFENHFKLNPKYTKLVIESDYTQKVIYGGSKGTTVDQLTIENAKDLFIPFPPAEEQERIVSALENALDQINFLEQNKSDLQSVIKQTKSKILDLAIHGKLVPQDPNDEPAEELLKRIVTSDNRPYKKFDDEEPFDIPDSWAWCRLKDICTVFGRIGFRGYTRDDLVEKGNGAITLSPSNLTNMKLDLTECTYISWPKYEESPEIQLDIDDVVIVKTGSSYGKSSLVDKLIEKTTLNPQLMVLKNRKCNSKYLCYFLNTLYMRKHFEDLVNGTAIPTFSQEKFSIKYFPLPPSSEQKRIVSKIEELFSYLDIISSNLE